MSDSSKVPSLGPRGEGWVALQVALIVAVALCGLAGGRLGHPWWELGAAVGSCGALVLAWGGLSLGRSLTPFPAPRAEGELASRGAYRFARHPMYGGGLLACAGWSLALAPWGLVPTAALALLFDLKSRREEAWLVERYPGYDAYRSRVRKRLVPFVY